MSFQEFELHERLQRAIKVAGYHEPTPIQVAAMPIALDGRDLVGTAQTGTGKTAAFALPMLQRLLTAPASARKTRALILTPTRELAEQIHAAIQELGRHTNIRSAPVYGGVGMAPQERALKNGTDIIVACPGRLLDHVARGNTDLSQVECLVLDEADRMLDMGFLPPVTRIIKLLPSDRQTMLFSATFAPALNAFVDETLRAPVRVAVDIEAPAETVEHTLYPITKELKARLLTALLGEISTESVLIFTRTRHRADQVARQLSRAGFDADVLHSDKSQRQRQQAMDSFRRGKTHCLVATDIAARGIDVATISHVINFDIPETVDDYIHRIGRTGRATRAGKAFTFITLEDSRTVRDIERVLGKEIETCFLDGFDYEGMMETLRETKPAPQKQSKSRPASRPATRKQPRAASVPRPASPKQPEAPVSPRLAVEKRAEAPHAPRSAARKQGKVQAVPAARAPKGPAARDHRRPRHTEAQADAPTVKSARPTGTESAPRARQDRPATKYYDRFDRKNRSHSRRVEKGTVKCKATRNR